MFPDYAGDIKTQLRKMGTSETVKFRQLRVDQDPAGGTQRRGGNAWRTDATADLARTDILYFRGHQFAAVTGAPGVFFRRRGGARIRPAVCRSGRRLWQRQAAHQHQLRHVVQGVVRRLPRTVSKGGDPRPIADRRRLPARRSAATFARKINALGRGLLLDQAVDVECDRCGVAIRRGKAATVARRSRSRRSSGAATWSSGTEKPGHHRGPEFGRKRLRIQARLQ
jgi:hypothetical protein